VSTHDPASDPDDAYGFDSVGRELALEHTREIISAAIAVAQANIVKRTTMRLAAQGDATLDEVLTAGMELIVAVEALTDATVAAQIAHDARGN
jgi:hypothetical protein